MFERFTDRARKVIALADQEAQRLGTGALAPEHILLGLLKEGHGVAAHVLRGFEVKFDAMRHSLEASTKTPADLPGQNASAKRRPRWPWTLTAIALRRLLSPHELPLTPESRTVIARSLHEARALGHNYVGTEHLLLGLLLPSEHVPAQLLSAQGLKLDDVRREVLELLGHRTRRQ